jgi:hypothetical protein
VERSQNFPQNFETGNQAALIEAIGLALQPATPREAKNGSAFCGGSFI